jgi:peptidyl-prolyl cis-trans isomerase B (cyclophilin B)
MEQKTINAVITMESGDKISLELYPDIAPITVENFVNLAKDGFYNGLIFHRVIAGFMIQGGDPMGIGIGGSGKNIKGEFRANGVENNLSHERGVISMARSQMPNSASSQFFICHADATFLDGQYAAFGRVIEGMETVDEIAMTRTNMMDKPLRDQKMEKVEIIEE